MIRVRRFWLRDRLEKLTVWALLLTALFCFLLGRAAAYQIESYSNLQTARGAGTATSRMYSDMKKREEGISDPFAFAIWTQLDKQTVKSPAHGRQAELSVIKLRGDPRLVLPGYATLAEDDFAGCLIDRKTANQLIGYGDPTGAVLTCEGREYTVRGVHDGPNQTAILQAPEEDPALLSNISMAVPTGSRADNFLMRQGLGGGLLYKADTDIVLAKVLAAAPFLVLVGWVLAALLRYRRRWQAYPVKSFACLVALCALVTAGVVFLISVLPDSLTPTRWSDFSFWTGAFDTLWTESFDKWAAARLRPDIFYLQQTLRSGWGVLSALLLALALGRIRGRLLPRNLTAPLILWDDVGTRGSGDEARVL